MTATFSTSSLFSQNHPIPDTNSPANYYLADQHLQLALQRYLAAKPFLHRWATERLTKLGAECANQIEPLYAVAEKNEPQLKQYDRRGERVDEIVFHPAYREIEKLAYGSGIAAMCNVSDFDNLGQPAPQLIKFAAMYLFTQAEGSLACPLSMTDILARVLNKYASPSLIARYLPHLTSLETAELYTGAMFMTEKTGGSDVGATTTIAVPTAEAGVWELSGDKWFCSNANADLILTLARPESAATGTRGLGLFLVPRVLPDNRRNSYQINRLKDKLGTRGMASGEITLNHATAYLIEPLERGFVMMMEMVNGTRLHSGVAGAASLRRATVEAVLHTRERVAFGRVLAEQPLMAEKLADMIVESQACTALMLATSHSLDQADAPDATREENLLARLLISLLKRYAAERGVSGAQTALEIRGGNGYIEDWPNSRLLRDAIVQTVWEGGINMVSFDVLRTIGREKAWPIYAKAIEAELDQISALSLPELGAKLRQNLCEVGEIVEQLFADNGEVAAARREIVAPQLAETLAVLYADVMLARDSDFALRTGEKEWGKRLEQAATRYHQRVVLASLAKLPRQVRQENDASVAKSLIGGTIGI